MACASTGHWPAGSCRPGAANTACPLVPLLRAGCPTTGQVPCGSACISSTTQCCKTDPSVGLCKSSFPSVCLADGGKQCCYCPVLDSTARGTLALKSTDQTWLTMGRSKALVFVTTATCSKTISITKVDMDGRGCSISALLRHAACSPWASAPGQEQTPCCTHAAPILCPILHCCPPPQATLGLCRYDPLTAPLVLSLHTVDSSGNPVNITGGLKRSRFTLDATLPLCNDTSAGNGAYLTFDFPVSLPGPAGTKYAFAVSYPDPSSTVQLQWSQPAATSTPSADFVGYRFTFDGKTWGSSTIYNTLWIQFDCS